jgi:hypothetical protein
VFPFPVGRAAGESLERGEHRGQHLRSYQDADPRAGAVIEFNPLVSLPFFRVGFFFPNISSAARTCFQMISNDRFLVP